MTIYLFIAIAIGYFLRPAIDKMILDFKTTNNKKRPAVKTNSRPSKSGINCLEKLAENNGAKMLQEP